MNRRHFSLSLFASLFACRSMASPAPASPALQDLPSDPEKVTPVSHSNEEWKKILDAESYNILREAGTERAFTGRYWDNHAKGFYLCAGCGLALFKSEDKFESGTGWPSFTRPYKTDRLREISDKTLGMVRTEVRCARCDGHLGHVFDDGPPPTNMRYCMNSGALIFRAS